MTVRLDGISLTRAQLVQVARGERVELDEASLPRVARAADFLAAQVARATGAPLSLFTGAKQAARKNTASAAASAAPVDAALSQRLKEQAVLAFHALDLYGLARVDFLLDRTTGEAFLNEVNTLPGFTSISMYPRLWQEAGIPFPQLLDRLVELGLKRYG